MDQTQPGSSTDQLDARQPLKLSYALRALRHRNFRLFFAGQLISLIGTWMQSVAQSWLVYRLTGSALLLGTVGFAGQIPVLLAAPLGGIVADRYNRHRIVIATQVASMVLALVLAWLTLTGYVKVWHVAALAACLGVVNAFDIPARQSFIVDMVGKGDLMNAIALNSSMFNSARMIGPAVAGILVASIGEGWCFFANGISYLAVIAGLLMMQVTPVSRQARADSPLENILEGFRFARSSLPIRWLLLLLALASLVGAPYAVLMPIFAGEILHGGPRALGILMGATGIGALLGALTLATRRGLRGLGRWIALASGGFGVSLILFAYSRVFWLSALILIPTGYALMVQMGSTNTLVQSMTPDHMRGRVMAIYSMMFMGMAPFGALLAGGAAHPFGAPVTVAAGGLLCIAGAIVYSRQLPAFREEARRLILAQQESREP
ncbi:MAG TPA: MFS transporter [Terriglobia bacterium]|nr:MFS transporter [Terriglobia bacterium]